MESDFATGAHLGYRAWNRLVDSVTGDITAIEVENREDISTSVGNATRSRADRRVDIDIPAWVAVEEKPRLAVGLESKQKSTTIPERTSFIQSVVCSDLVNVPMGSYLSCQGQERSAINHFHHELKAEVSCICLGRLRQNI